MILLLLIYVAFGNSNFILIRLNSDQNELKTKYENRGNDIRQNSDYDQDYDYNLDESYYQDYKGYDDIFGKNYVMLLHWKFNPNFKFELISYYYIDNFNQFTIGSPEKDKKEPIEPSKLISLSSRVAIAHY